MPEPMDPRRQRIFNHICKRMEGAADQKALAETLLDVLPSIDGRCEACRWWQPAAGIPEGQGECLLMRTEGMEPVYPDTLAVAQDAENLQAWVVTAANFGCVLWEGREAGD